MNYLAHLYFAKQTSDSHFGNLLGDFQKGLDVKSLKTPVRLALQNHLLVDKFTDSHSSVRQSRELFNAEHRRFAPVALDILYDHYLVKHWKAFSNRPFEQFTTEKYAYLEKSIADMPSPMQKTVSHMIEYNGLARYKDAVHVERSIEYVANKIRFKNSFANSWQDIEQNYTRLEKHFLDFFPELINQVDIHSPEN